MSTDAPDTSAPSEPTGNATPPGASGRPSAAVLVAATVVAVLLLAMAVSIGWLIGRVSDLDDRDDTGEEHSSEIPDDFFPPGSFEDFAEPGFPPFGPDEGFAEQDFPFPGDREPEPDELREFADQLQAESEDLQRQAEEIRAEADQLSEPEPEGADANSEGEN